MSIKHYKNIIHLLFLVLIKVVIYGLFVYLVYEVIFDYTAFNGHRITQIGFKNELLVLLNLGLIIFFVSRRFYFAIFMSVFLYFLFIYISLEKIKFFNVPLLPSDFGYVDQLILIWPIFKLYIPKIILTIILFSMIIYVFIKTESQNHFLKQSHYLANGFIIIIVFAGFIGGTGLYHSLKYKMAYNERGRSHLVSSSEKNGLLVTFIRNILHSNNNDAPNGYSKERMKNIYNTITQYPSQNSNKEETDTKINLIIYLIESFTDPRDAGIKTTIDPIPFFHQLQKVHESGFVYTPEIGGRSANVEFELLTGFSMHFFFSSTIPFIDLPVRKIPSIARELNAKQYYTKVIQAANLGFFNYKQMYSTLGFQDVITLDQKKDVQLDIAGLFPSDNEIVDEIIQTSKENERFFIYAFPNSTHGAWKYSQYDNSRIDLILDNPLTDSDGQKQLRTYINALNTADKAIKKLINHFEKQDTKTAIIILGDHQPGIPEFREQYMLKNFPNKFTFKTRKQLRSRFMQFDIENPLLSYKIMHKTPYVLWTNYKTNNSTEFNNGMNSLVLKIFDKIKIVPESPFYSFLREYSRNTVFEALLKYVFYNSEDLSIETNELIQKYENIQYDILLGDEYFLEK